MLQYNLDVEKNSTWLRSTPSPQELVQPYYCTEVGCFYALRGFTTARSNKNSFIVFYTLHGAGLVRQGGQEVRLEKGQALLMDCRSPQSYGTALDSARWDHLWAHVDGAGVAAIGQLMGLPTLAPVQLHESFARKCFQEIESNVQRESVPSTLRTGLAVHELLSAMALELAESALQGAEAEPVERAMRVVEERYAEDITVDDIPGILLTSARVTDELTGRVSTGGMLDMKAALSLDKELINEAAANRKKSGSSPEIYTQITNQLGRDYLVVKVKDMDGNLARTAYAEGNLTTLEFLGGTAGKPFALNALGIHVFAIKNGGTYTFYAADESGNETIKAVAL